MEEANAFGNEGNAIQSSAASGRERGCSFEPLFISGGLSYPNRSTIPLR
jgi:hypothetical protein